MRVPSYVCLTVWMCVSNCHRFLSHLGPTASPAGRAAIRTIEIILRRTSISDLRNLKGRIYLPNPSNSLDYILQAKSCSPNISLRSRVKNSILTKYFHTDKRVINAVNFFYHSHKALTIGGSVIIRLVSSLTGLDSAVSVNTNNNLFSSLVKSSVPAVQ